MAVFATTRPTAMASTGPTKGAFLQASGKTILQMEMGLTSTVMAPNISANLEKGTEREKGKCFLRMAIFTQEIGRET